MLQKALVMSLIQQYLPESFGFGAINSYLDTPSMFTIQKYCSTFSYRMVEQKDSVKHIKAGNGE